MNIRLILLILLGVAILLLVASLLLQRRKKGKTRRSFYVDALYALIEGRKKRALNLLTRAVKDGEEDIDAYLQLGHLLREFDQPARALQIHRGLTVRRDLLPAERRNILLAIAGDLKEMGRAEKALRELENIGKKERNKEVYQLMHQLHHIMGNYQEAFDSLKQLAGLGDGLTESHLAGYLAAVSELMMTDDQFDKAEKWLRKAIRTYSDSIPAIYLSADLAMRKGNTGDAIKYWTSLLKVSTEDFNWVFPRLEKSLYESGKFHQLESILESMLDHYSGNPSVINALASFYEKKGETERAVRVLESNEEAAKGEPFNRMKLALLYLKSDRGREAEELLDTGEDMIYQDTVFSCSKCGERLHYPARFCNACYSFDSYHKSDES